MRKQQNHFKKFILFVGLFSLMLGIVQLNAQEFWTKLPGPEGGNVQAIATDHTGGDQQGTMFVGIYGGGMFRSENGGNTWTEVNDGLSDPFVHDILINNSILVGTSSGIYKSKNNGDSWQKINSGLPGDYPRARALANSSSGVIFVAIHDQGVFFSTNDGEEWSACAGNDMINTRIRDIGFNDGGDLFVVGLGGIYRSSDNGANFTHIIDGLSDEEVYSISFFRDNFNDEGILAGLYGGGAYISMYNGDSWVRKNTNLSNLGIFSTYTNNENNLYLGTEDGVFKSTDFGENWEQQGQFHERVFCFTQNDDQELFSGTWAGAFKYRMTDDSWMSMNAGIHTGGYSGITIDFDNNLYAVSLHAGKIHFSNDGGLSWSIKMNGIDGNIVKGVYVDNDGNLYAGTEGGIFFSNNKGDTWFPRGLQILTIRDIEFNSENYIYAATGQGLHISIDNGTNWAPVLTLMEQHIEDILSIPNSTNIFVGASSNYIFRSTDNGLSWTQVNTGLTHSNINTLAVNEAGYIFAGTVGGGIYRSINNGDSWEAVNEVVGGVSTIYVANKIIRNSLDHLYAGTTSGVYFSHTNGDSWIRLGQGLTAQDINDLAFNNEEYLYAATNVRGGIFSSVIPTVLPAPELSLPVDGTVDISASPTLIWIPVPGAESYILEVSRNPEFTDLVFTQGEITGLSFQVSGLDGKTDYYWRVRAAYYAGETEWSDVWMFTTKLAPPVLSTPTDGSVNIVLEPVLEWNASNGALTYDLEYSEDQNFINNVGRNRGITETSIQLTGLSYDRTYFWRVNANAESSTSDWSEVWSFTTYMLPAAGTQPASEIGVVSARLHASVNPRGHRVNVEFEYGENISTPEPRILLTETPVQHSENIAFDEKVSGLKVQTQYFYRVVISEAGGLFTVDGDIENFTTSSYPQNININTMISFPSHDQADAFQTTDYRMIGVPGQRSERLNISNFLSGEPGKDWQVYWDNGSNSDNPDEYLEAYDGSDRFNLGNGHALWVIHKGDVNINESGIATVPLGNEYMAVIDLHQGWNMITNPFDTPIPWWQIQQSNSIDARPIFWWENGWSSPFVFEPNKGYYFDNSGSPALSFLNIPYRSILEKHLSESEYNWLVKISLSSRKIFDSATTFGTSTLAEDGLDVMDFAKPRAIGSVPSVTFERPQWDGDYKQYATDIRPPIEDVQSWPMTVTAYPGERAELSFSGIEMIPEQFDVVLINHSKYSYHNLRQSETYSFIPETEYNHFEILVGRQDLVMDQVQQIVPTEFILGKNFPNPFNPSTSIPVTIPEAADISLKVYDILGKEIRTLYEGAAEPGRHYYRWDGTSYDGRAVSAGIYLYKLSIVNGPAQLGKMVLVK